VSQPLRSKYEKSTKNNSLQRSYYGVTLMHAGWSWLMISVCSAWAVYEPSEIWQRVDVRLPLIPAQTEGHPARPVKSTSNHHKKHTESHQDNSFTNNIHSTSRSSTVCRRREKKSLGGSHSSTVNPVRFAAAESINIQLGTTYHLTFLIYLFCLFFCISVLSSLPLPLLPCLARLSTTSTTHDKST
jgi:hypothetical protein